MHRTILTLMTVKTRMMRKVMMEERQASSLIFYSVRIKKECVLVWSNMLHDKLIFQIKFQLCFLVTLTLPKIRLT